MTVPRGKSWMQPEPLRRERAETPVVRVLVVDDVVDAAETMATMLQLWGYEARTAHDGTSAIEAARNFVPHVVLLDIGMPHMNGLEVARQLRRFDGENRPILIALTGHGRPEDKRHTLESGFDHHLTKPVDSDELRNMLAQLHCA